MQAFALAGPNSPPGSIGNEVKLIRQSYRQAPTVAGINAWIQGDNLAETLILSLTAPYDCSDDRAAWEIDHPKDLHDVSVQLGTADLYTWQSRYISLKPIEKENHILVDPEILFSVGRIPGDVRSDPMKCSYFKSKKEGLKLVYFNPEKSTWRNSHALFGSGDHKHPEIFNTMKFLLVEDAVDRFKLFQINVAGMLNDQGKVITWYHDRMPAPAALFEEETLQSLVENAIDDANKMESSLGKRVWRLCTFYLSKDQSNPDRDDISRLLNHLNYRDFYWSPLERHFYKFLCDLPEKREQARAEWRETLKKTARKSLRKASEQLGQSLRAFIARAQVSDYFAFKDEKSAPAKEEVKA